MPLTSDHGIFLPLYDVKELMGEGRYVSLTSVIQVEWSLPIGEEALVEAFVFSYF